MAAQPDRTCLLLTPSDPRKHSTVSGFLLQLSVSKRSDAPLTLTLLSLVRTMYVEQPKLGSTGSRLVQAKKSD